MKEREDQEKGDAEEEILGGGVGRMERGPDVGDSGSTLIMSRRNLVMTLRPEDRWHFCTWICSARMTHLCSTEHQLWEFTCKTAHWHGWQVGVDCQLVAQLELWSESFSSFPHGPLTWNCLSVVIAMVTGFQEWMVQGLGIGNANLFKSGPKKRNSGTSSMFYWSSSHKTWPSSS